MYSSVLCSEFSALYSSLTDPAKHNRQHAIGSRYVSNITYCRSLPASNVDIPAELKYILNIKDSWGHILYGTPVRKGLAET